MTIQVTTPDGGVALFPDDTSPDKIRTAMRAKFGGGPAKGVAKEMTGEVPVKGSQVMGIDTGKMVGNIVPGLENLATGTAETAFGAAKALVNPNPGGKVKFIEDTAKGVWDSLKTRYKGGISKAIENDPVGVLSDVLSVAGAIHGVRSGVGAEVPTRAATRATDIAARDQAADVANKTSTGVGPTPMDRGGTAVASQVERLANTASSGAREVIAPFLERRQSESFGRIASQLSDLVGTKRTARQALDETMAAQQKAATPAYLQAYNSGDRIVWSNELERLTGAPDVQKAMKIAINRWQNSAIADGYGAAKPGAIAASNTFDEYTTDTIVSHPNMGGKLLKIVGGRVPVMPNLQFWDYTRRSIDGMIDKEIRPDGRLTTRGRDLMKFRNGINSELDKIVPEYKAARQAWSGPESYKNALEFGNGLYSQSADDFIADFKSLEGADKQAARESVVTKILSDLEKKSTNVDVDLRDLTAKLKTRDMQKKILAILPDDASRQKWMANLKAEVRSSKLVGQGLKNSATARRLAQAQEASDLIGDMVLGVAHASDALTLGATTKLRIIARGWQNLKAKIQSQTDKELAKILTGKATSTKIKGPSPTVAAPVLSIGNQQQ